MTTAVKGSNLEKRAELGILRLMRASGHVGANPKPAFLAAIRERERAGDDPTHALAHVASASPSLHKAYLIQANMRDGRVAVVSQLLKRL